MLGSSWVAAQLEASKEGLSSMSEWVSNIYLRMTNIEWKSEFLAETEHESVVATFINPAILVWTLSQADSDHVTDALLSTSSSKFA
jgi:hypothetical protein